MKRLVQNNSRRRSERQEMLRQPLQLTPLQLTLLAMLLLQDPCLLTWALFLQLLQKRRKEG